MSKLRKTPDIEPIKAKVLDESLDRRNKVKFYADTPNNEKNKLFTFIVKDYKTALKLIFDFQKKGFNIRSAYYDFCIAQLGQRFNLQIELKKPL
jgi:hypothetical protein